MNVPVFSPARSNSLRAPGGPRPGQAETRRFSRSLREPGELGRGPKRRVGGTRSAAVLTNDSGDYVFPNVTPDTYTVEVTAPSFKTLRRTGIVVTGGDRVGVPPLTLEVGGTAETVSVTAEGALVQTQSGERSFAVEQKQVESLPGVRGNFTSLVALVPGVNGGDTTSAGGTRLGGASQNNIMMDGISAMDTGNNGQMLSMNIESIGEVKVLTQGYQAEYGRSSGCRSRR